MESGDIIVSGIVLLHDSDRRSVPAWLVAALAALAGLAWAPFVDWPLSPDEGGLLLVASQWEPGHSLYGHYWVDRPPLLLTLFDLATHLGGAIGLRLMGIGFVVASVLLTSVLTGRAVGRRSLTPIVVAAVFLSTPLFGTTEVDGELLAVPFVLLGMLSLVRAWAARPPVAVAWAVGAGAAGMSAVLIKQNVVDVFVVTGVVVVMSARTSGLRRATLLMTGVLGGAGGVLGAMLAVAEARGTEPYSLWDALVVFRANATAVIQTSASSATSDRFVTLLTAVLLSGAPVVLLVLVLPLRRPARSTAMLDLRLPALAVLLWEVAAVAGGGSYWLHYLIGLVPGMVLLAVAAAQRGRTPWRTTGVAVAFTVVSCLVAVVTAATSVPRGTTDAEVAAYLRDHGSPRDSVIVAFGHPDIVWDAGLRSPYEQLWSLPVRVRDPSLAELTRVLEGRHAPTWVVVPGPSLATWGVDAETAQRALDEHYRPETSVGPYVVWRRVPTATARASGRSPARQRPDEEPTLSPHAARAPESPTR
jgi:hypothetical protein